MLRSLGLFIRRVMAALMGLVLVAGALALGALVATGLLLRLAWLRHRARGVGRSRPPGARPAHGDIIDVEARESRESREARPGPYDLIAATDPCASALRRP